MHPSLFQRVLFPLLVYLSHSELTLLVSSDYLGDMMDLCYSRRAENLDYRYLDQASGTSSRIMLTCTLPLSEIVTDFFDKLKSRSSGFASFEWVT
jgi:translation factor GUF1, mitochondrial